jgi:hypothetical protein
MLLSGIVSLLATQSACDQAFASGKLELPNKEVDSDTSPFIQALKAKSDSLRDQRKKERLEAYYRKVFTDYFEFEAGDNATAKARGISSETNEKIRKWLAEGDSK